MPTARDIPTITDVPGRLQLGSADSFLAALRLGSAALPIGAFAYSQGLEQAVAIGAVHDRGSAERWIAGVLEHTLLSADVPLLARILEALNAGDLEQADRWSDFLYATRGTQELRAEELQLGRSLYRWLERLAEPRAARFRERPRATLIGAFALSALRYGLSREVATLTYAFAWSEAQVGAASRLVPLGQTDAQLVLSHALGLLGAGFSRALALEDDEIGATAPGQTLLSAAHETQYSRLFRS
jgi:urease accessory protein